MLRSEIRQQVLAQRDGLSASRRQELSAAAIARVLALPAWRASQAVLLYASFRSELPTQALIAEALSQGKQVCLPQCLVATKALVPRCIQGMQDLKIGAYGIIEPDPEKTQALDPSALSLVLVPAAVFDRRGHRLGYGAGYYDRFLPSCPQAFTLGLGFGLQLVDQLPIEPHDVALKALATEQGVLKF